MKKNKRKRNIGPSRLLDLFTLLYCKATCKVFTGGRTDGALHKEGAVAFLRRGMIILAKDKITDVNASR